MTAAPEAVAAARDVLRIEDGKIAEITELFEAFGVPPTL